MHSPTKLLILSLTLHTLRVLSLAHPGPKATDSASNLPNSVGWTPKPTAVPFPNSPLELLRRQNYASINTCGWIDGNAADPYYCADGYACSANLAASYFGCCETDTAGSFLSADCAYIATPYTGCFDYTQASACTGPCYTENQVCDFSYPYCAMATMNVGAQILTNYACSTDIYVRAQDVETAILYTSSFGGGTSASAVVITTASAALTTPSTTSATSPVASSSSPSASSNSSLTGSSKPSTNHTAEVAGAVVGGLIVLAAIVGGVIFGLHHRKQRQRKVIAPEISQMM